MNTLVGIQGAGHTDAGLCALGQVAHMECITKINPETVHTDMHGHLPTSINVLSIVNAHPCFLTQEYAVSRNYLYLIANRHTALTKNMSGELGTIYMSTKCSRR